jgi:3-oxoacyl-[acyl-carrier protein] reductase
MPAQDADPLQVRPSPYRLDGRIAVVTGSSSGLGRAIALTFAAAGAHVVVHARRRQAAAEETVAAIDRLGREAHVVMADLAEPAARDGLLREAWNWRGRVDIWVNNAGADVLTGDAARWTFEQKLEYLWRVDVEATVQLARAAGQRMRQAAEHSAGVIINMGWDQAAHGMAGDSGEMFAVAKGAVMAFTKSLAKSLAPHVRVNCIAPGWIRTAWGRTASPAWQTRAVQESLLQRWGEPDDVASAALFLASPAAAFINGQVILVNGGFRCET